MLILNEYIWNKISDEMKFGSNFNTPIKDFFLLDEFLLKLFLSEYKKF